MRFPCLSPRPASPPRRRMSAATLSRMRVVAGRTTYNAPKQILLSMAEAKTETAVVCCVVCCGGDSLKST
jgi:hypothetical protein